MWSCPTAWPVAIWRKPRFSPVTDALAIVVSESSMVRVFDDRKLVAEVIPELWLIDHYDMQLAKPYQDAKLYPKRAGVICLLTSHLPVDKLVWMIESERPAICSRMSKVYTALTCSSEPITLQSQNALPVVSHNRS